MTFIMIEIAHGALRIFWGDDEFANSERGGGDVIIDDRGSELSNDRILRDQRRAGCIISSTQGTSVNFFVLDVMNITKYVVGCRGK